MSVVTLARPEAGIVVALPLIIVAPALSVSVQVVGEEVVTVVGEVMQVTFVLELEQPNGQVRVL